MQGSSTIVKLPPYLTIQLVRFFYKREVQQKSKILRKVRRQPSDGGVNHS